MKNKEDRSRCKVCDILELYVVNKDKGMLSNREVDKSVCQTVMVFNCCTVICRKAIQKENGTNRHGKEYKDVKIAVLELTIFSFLKLSFILFSKLGGNFYFKLSIINSNLEL